MNSYGMCDSFSLFFHCQSDLGADKKMNIQKKMLFKAVFSYQFHIILVLQSVSAVEGSIVIQKMNEMASTLLATNS